MDPTSIIESLLSSGPLAVLLFFMWYQERKDKIRERARAEEIADKHESYLRENADRLLAFSDEQRKALADHDRRIEDIIDHSKRD